MNTTLNIILLFEDEAYDAHPDNGFPFYLSDRDGVTQTQLLINYCANLNPANIICMLPTEDIRKYRLHDMVAQTHPSAAAFPVHGRPEGSACTAILASKLMTNNCELFILSTNDIVDISIVDISIVDISTVDIVNQFRTEGYDAGVVICRSPHPRTHSVRLNDAGDIVEVVEKNPNMSDAIVGMYWFKNGAMFAQAVQNMIRKDARIDYSFHIPFALNELILLQKRIGTYRVQPNQSHPLKIESQIYADVPKSKRS
jgi:hypothetical protein